MPSGRPKLQSSVDTSLSRSTSGSPPTVPTARRCSGEQCAQGTLHTCVHTQYSTVCMRYRPISSVFGYDSGVGNSSGNRLKCKTFRP